jgi:hypothetical protein
MVHDNHGILEVVAGFYKELFKWKSRGNVSLEPNFWSMGDLVTGEENSDLVPPFSEDEIREVVFSCYPEGSLGTDGMCFLFYQKY